MQFGKQNIGPSAALGVVNTAGGGLDPALTTCVVNTGDQASDDEILLELPSGGNGLVITSVAYSVGVAEDTTAQVFLFWRRITVGSTTGQRAISINAADGTGATTMTIPTTQAIGDCYRVYFGGDADEDHVLNPGESFAIELETTGTGQTATGAITVHGYMFDVGPQIPVNGTAHTAAQSKPNANGTGSIYNLIA